MTNEKRDKLNEAVLLCTIHSERMSFAWKKIKTHFPLDREKYIRLKPEELSFVDQLIFRFSKMQDSMGGKLFPAILENLGENVKGLPFIDQLVKLEELNIIPDADEWMLLRETRNIVTHEYPFVTDEVVQGLNLLSKHYQLITDIWKQTESYIITRFQK
ncbi:MAG: toxin-antitoxin system antitoxin subunit [Bacteroidales bacterium]